jgi:hypothetical protein
MSVGFSRTFLLGILIFKGFTARRLYKSFFVKGLITPITLPNWTEAKIILLLEFWDDRRVVSLRYVLFCAGSKKLTHFFLYLFTYGHKLYLWYRMRLKQAVLTISRRPEWNLSLWGCSDNTMMIICTFILRCSAPLYSVQCVLAVNCFPTCTFTWLLCMTAIHWQKKPWKILYKCRRNLPELSVTR